MPLVTITSDFGYQDHYAAAVKARVLQHCPDATLVDISHGIEPFNIAQGAHVLQAVYHEFPLGTVHIFAVHSLPTLHKPIAFQHAGHFFVGNDNGFAGLLTTEEISQCVALAVAPNQTLTFAAQALYAPVAAQLAQGALLQQVGLPHPTPQTLIAIQPRLTEDQIIGHIIHIDHYGNLVSNIPYDVFAQRRKDRKFEIRVARETLYTLHTHYTQVEPGDCVCVFNSSSLLEIAIHQGNAAALLGMRVGSPIAISFAKS